MTEHTPEKVNELIQPGFAPLLNRVRAEGWFAGYDKGNLDGYFGTSKERENSPYAEFDPYREQSSEGNET